MLLAFLALAGWRLDEPHRQVFDEQHHAWAALEMLEGRAYSDMTHPPLPRAVMAASLTLGNAAVPTAGRKYMDGMSAYPAASTWWWRLPSLLMAGVALAALYALGLALGLPWPAALLATALLALDGCFFVHARLAMTNVWEIAFQLLAAGAAWRAAEAEGRKPWILASAVAAGLAVACRWTSLPVIGLLGMWLAWRLRRDWGRLHLVVLAFGLGMPLTYLATWAPLVALGPLPGAADLLSPSAWWEWAIARHSGMVGGHLAANAILLPGIAPWWSWPLVNEPMWYWQQTEPDGRFRAVWAIGNPVIWWASVPALAWAAREGWRGRPEAGLVALLGLGAWLAWAVNPRSHTYMHYYLPTIPYACLAIALAAHVAWTGARRRDDPGRAAVALYVLAAGTWFGWFLPLLASLPVPMSFVLRHIWLGEAWLQ